MNNLGFRDVPFRIVCDAPTRVALRIVDNRAASRVAGVTGQRDAANFGLGTARGANIGGYTMLFYRVGGTIDGQAMAPPVISANGGTSWALSSGILVHTVSLVGFRGLTNTAHAPVAFTTMNAFLRVNAYIDRTSNLDLTNDVSLDGSATLELVYLYRCVLRRW